MHYQTEPPAAYIKCAPKAARKVLYGIAMTETAGTGDPLQLVDTSTLRVYRPSNPGKALAIIHGSSSDRVGRSSPHGTR